MARSTAGSRRRSRAMKVTVALVLRQTLDIPPLTLAEEQQEFRRQLRQCCDDKIAPLAASNDARGDYSWETFRALQSMKRTALQLPAEYGGAGADLVTQPLATEELAR